MARFGGEAQSFYRIVTGCLQLSIDRDQLDVVRQQVGAGMNDSF